MIYPKKIASIVLLALCSCFLFGQTTVKLSGKILADDLSPLANASVYIAQFSSGTYSDSLGNFQVNLQSGLNEISFSYIGYNSEIVKLFLSRDTSIEIKLKTKICINTRNLK